MDDRTLITRLLILTETALKAANLTGTYEARINEKYPGIDIYGVPTAPAHHPVFTIHLAERAHYQTIGRRPVLKTAYVLISWNYYPGNRVDEAPEWTDEEIDQTFVQEDAVLKMIKLLNEDRIYQAWESLAVEQEAEKEAGCVSTSQA